MFPFSQSYQFIHVYIVSSYTLATLKLSSNILHLVTSQEFWWHKQLYKRSPICPSESSSVAVVALFGNLWGLGFVIINRFRNNMDELGRLNSIDSKNVGTTIDSANWNPSVSRTLSASFQCLRYLKPHFDTVTTRPTSPPRGYHWDRRHVASVIPCLFLSDVQTVLTISMVLIWTTNNQWARNPQAKITCSKEISIVWFKQNTIYKWSIIKKKKNTMRRHRSPHLPGICDLTTERRWHHTITALKVYTQFPVKKSLISYMYLILT